MLKNLDFRQSQSKKPQNYFQFRSSEYQRTTTNHSTKSYLFNNKQIISSNRLYMRDRTNMYNGENIQEYSRYRDATFCSPIKV
jgi:hypothetical protein